MRHPRLGLVPAINYNPDGQAGIGIHPRWRNRARMLISSINNPKAHAELKPYLLQAEIWLEAAMTQLAAASGGVCGPIESNALATSAWQTAYSRFWMARAAQDPENSLNLKMVETASRIADAARANSLAAYDIAVRLHRHAPANPDPLAFMDAQDRALPPKQKPPSKPKPDLTVEAVGADPAEPPSPSDTTLDNEGFLDD